MDKNKYIEKILSEGYSINVTGQKIALKVIKDYLRINIKPGLLLKAEELYKHIFNVSQLIIVRLAQSWMKHKFIEEKIHKDEVLKTIKVLGKDKSIFN